MAETIVMTDRVKFQVSNAEWALRCDLAAAFRVAHQRGWNDGATNHITARLPDNPDHFLINPQGIGFDETTASCLVKADVSGRLISHAGIKPGPAGLNFHSAVLGARPDVICTMHIHPMQVVAVSATKQGLMILDQRGCLLHEELAYHDFEGYADEKDEAPRIVAELGMKHTMIMRNHGLLGVGRTVGETFYFVDKLIGACELQERVLAMGVEVNPVPPEVVEVASRQLRGRYGDKPFGEMDWKLERRRLEKSDQSFAE